MKRILLALVLLAGVAEAQQLTHREIYTGAWQTNATTGTLTQDATKGGNIVINRGGYGMFAGTADAADSIYVTIAGGGAGATTRGGSFIAVGNEYPTDAFKGRLRAVMGDGDGATNKGTFTIENGTGTLWTFGNGGTLTATVTNVGWVVRAGANTACTTTCGANKGCLFGIDAGASAVVACTTTTADTCLCTQ